MKFQTKIIGMPVHILAQNRPPPAMSTYTQLTEFPQLSPNSGVVFDNYKIWLTLRSKIITAGNSNVNGVNSADNVLDVSAMDKDAANFTVEILNRQKVDDYIIYEAQIMIANKYLALDNFGLVLVDSPITLKLVSNCASIIDGGLFTFMNNDNKYAVVLRDSSGRPLLGVTDDQRKASSFYFTWTINDVSKKYIAAFLKVRYYIDNPDLLPRRDDIDQIKPLYDELSRIIIRQIKGESQIIDDSFTNVFFDRGSDKGPGGGDLDDYRAPSYDPLNFLEKSSQNYSSGFLEKSSQNNLLKLQKDPSTVEYQRSVMEENSDFAVKSNFQESENEGIYQNASRVLFKVGVHPQAWDMIDKAVMPIGMETNVHPAVLIYRNNKLGINFYNPFIKTMKFIRRPEDGEVNGGIGMAVYVDGLPEKNMNKYDSNTYKGDEHFCGHTEYTSRLSSFSLILILIIILVCICCRRMMKENKEQVIVP